MSKNLLYHFVRAANKKRSMWASLSVETRAGDCRPSALLPDVCDGTGVAGKEVISRLLGRRRDVAQGVYADLQSIGRVPRTIARLPIEIDERTEAARFPADDGDHQRKPQRAGTSE